MSPDRLLGITHASDVKCTTSSGGVNPANHTSPSEGNPRVAGCPPAHPTSAGHSVGVGFCTCGCGGLTNLAPRSDPAYGWVKGQPLRYINNHHRRSSSALYLEDPATGCWVWQLSLDTSGYGQKWHQGRQALAHRFYYEQARGPIPEGLQIDHLCRNRACVNPDHMEPVTSAENQRRGNNTKLTIDDVRAIRAERVSGTDVSTLAKTYGVTKTHVYYIVNHQKWREDDSDRRQA